VRVTGKAHRTQVSRVSSSSKWEVGAIKAFDDNDMYFYNAVIFNQDDSYDKEIIFSPPISYYNKFRIIVYKI
jgi:hypothetical protein